MSAACDLLEAELAVDRVEATLAAELPAHVRTFARAYAAGAASPPAPAVGHGALRGLTGALRHPILADRALALARLLVPLAIESDPRVTAARATATTWPAYAALARARDEVAQARFGRGFVELVHVLHGVGAIAHAAGDVEALAAWHERDGLVLEPADVRTRWRELARAHGLAIEPQLLASTARPRAFVVEPGREVILVVPARLDTPYARFAALHELGHALVAGVAPAGTPRVVDEAVASWVARAMESPGDPWHAPLAREARARRTALAAQLATVEGGAAVFTGAVPWALVHDPGAQASYVVAEELADRIPVEGIRSWLAVERARIDRAARW